MAAIMCCHRSVYSWDVVVNVFDTPSGKKIFFDKRDDSDFDYVSVDETATVKDSEENPISLAQEATYLNKVFSQMVLKKGADKTYVGASFKEPHPFADGDEPQASVGYRYRKWLVGDVNLVARTEHDAVYKTKEGRTGFMNIKALNEYKRDQKMDWRRGLGSQSGAVLATELKNNSCKIARWTTAAMLSGSSLLRLGYLSRKTANPQQGHVMLGSQAFKPRDLAAQTSLNIKNGWAILKEIISTVQKYDQGKYVLLKDPNKPVLRLYSVPQNSFEEDDDSSEDEDEDEDADGIGVRVKAGDDDVRLTND